MGDKQSFRIIILTLLIIVALVMCSRPSHALMAVF